MRAWGCRDIDGVQKGGVIGDGNGWMGDGYMRWASTVVYTSYDVSVEESYLCRCSNAVYCRRRNRFKCHKTSSDNCEEGTCFKRSFMLTWSSLHGIGIDSPTKAAEGDIYIIYYIQADRACLTALELIHKPRTPPIPTYQLIQSPVPQFSMLYY